MLKDNFFLNLGTVFKENYFVAILDAAFIWLILCWFSQFSWNQVNLTKKQHISKPHQQSPCWTKWTICLIKLISHFCQNIDIALIWVVTVKNTIKTKHYTDAKSTKMWRLKFSMYLFWTYKDDFPSTSVIFCTKLQVQW